MLHRIIRRNDYLYIIDYLVPSIGDWTYNEHWGHSQITDNAALYGKGYHNGAFKIIAHLPLNKVKQLESVPVLPSINKELVAKEKPIGFISNGENDWTGEYIYEGDNHLFKNRFFLINGDQSDFGDGMHQFISDKFMNPNSYTEIDGQTGGDNDFICVDLKNKEWCWCENGYYPFCNTDDMVKYQHLPSITLADLVKRRS
jgi:hypothetical protein